MGYLRGMRLPPYKGAAALPLGNGFARRGHACANGEQALRKQQNVFKTKVPPLRGSDIDSLSLFYKGAAATPPGNGSCSE